MSRIKVVDAISGAALIQQQVTAYSNEIYGPVFPEVNSREYVPNAGEVSEGQKHYFERVVDIRGDAALVSPNTDAIPLLQLSGSGNLRTIAEIALGHEYSLSDLETDNLAGVDRLIQRAELAVRQRHEHLIEKLVWVGSTAEKIYGLLTHPNVLRIVSAYTFDSNSTAANIFSQLSVPFEAMAQYAPSEIPNTVILSPAAYEHIAGRDMGTSAGKTVLQAFREARPEIKVVKGYWLKDVTLGSATSDQMILMRAGDAMKCEQITPMIAKSVAPQPYNLMVKSIMRSKTAGVVAHYPWSICVMSGL